MKLIGSLTSPFVRKVRVALIEKNIPFELVIDMRWSWEPKCPITTRLEKFRC